MYIADTLSRAPVCSVEREELSFQEEVELSGTKTVANLPASTKKINFCQQKQQEDLTCLEILYNCRVAVPVSL